MNLDRAACAEPHREPEPKAVTGERFAPEPSAVELAQLVSPDRKAEPAQELVLAHTPQRQLAAERTVPVVFGVYECANGTQCEVHSIQPLRWAQGRSRSGGAVGAGRRGDRE